MPAPSASLQRLEVYRGGLPSGLSTASPIAARSEWHWQGGLAFLVALRTCSELSFDDAQPGQLVV